HLLARVLNETGGNQLRAARILGISRNSLRAKIRSLKLVIERSVYAADLGPRAAGPASSGNGSCWFVELLFPRIVGAAQLLDGGGGEFLDARGHAVLAVEVHDLSFDFGKGAGYRDRDALAGAVGVVDESEADPVVGEGLGLDRNLREAALLDQTL